MICANQASWQIWKLCLCVHILYFLLSAFRFCFGHTHAINHILSGPAAGAQSLTAETLNEDKMMFYIFCDKLRRSVVAAGEKQATADYRISKRYNLQETPCLCLYAVYYQ